MTKEEFNLGQGEIYSVPKLPRIEDSWFRALAFELNQLGLGKKGHFFDQAIRDWMLEDNQGSEV